MLQKKTRLLISGKVQGVNYRASANKKPQHECRGFILAEREGFEPYVSEGQSWTVEENQQVII